MSFILQTFAVTYLSHSVVLSAGDRVNKAGNTPALRELGLPNRKTMGFIYFLK